MKRTKPAKTKKEHSILLLPEDMTGTQLRSWARKTKTPLFKKKMRRTKASKIDRSKLKLPKKLTLISRYLKHKPGLKRTKFNQNGNLN